MCGWELTKDNQQNPEEYTCTNKNCREHTFYDIDKWAFRSRAWEVHICLPLYMSCTDQNRNVTSST